MKNWPTKKLGEVADCTDGDWILSKDLQTGKEVRLIQLGDIGEGVFLDKTDKWISKKRCKELKCTILKQGDILLARLGDPLGKACIFPGFSYPCITAVDVTIIRVKSQLDPNFLLDCLSSQFFRNQIYEVASGATRKRISRRNLEHLQIPFPPLDVQKRIVKKIEKLFGKIDEAEKLRKEAIEDTENLLKSAMQEVFERGKKEDWPTKKLGEVCKIEKGKKPTLYKEKKEDFLPYLIAETLRNDHIKYYASISDKNSIPVKESEIIIICDGSNSGDVFKGYKGILASTMGKVVHTDEIDTEYLFLFLKKNFKYLNSDKTGAATPHLNKEKFENLQIPLPPLSKQKQIVAYLDSLSKKIRQLKELQNQTARELSLLRQSILEKAFKGELK